MRRRLNGLGVAAIVGAGVSSAALLATIVGALVVNGAGAFSPRFLLTGSRDFGTEGGVLHQALGTLALLVGAALVALPLALGAGLFVAYYLSPALRRRAGLVIAALNGIPSVVFGLFGLAVFVHALGLGVSWLSGSLVLGTMILPTVMVTFSEALRRIPRSHFEAAYGMGLTRPVVMARVAIPESRSGLVTGLLLGLARAAGETAPIMFTATVFSGAELPRSPLEPVATLQTHVLFLAQEANNLAALGNAWGAALVLLLIVFGLSGAAAWLRAGRRSEVTS